MRLLFLCTWTIAALTYTAAVQTTDGLYNLVSRRMPYLVGSFVFVIDNPSDPYKWENDAYMVTTNLLGQISIEGSSLSALAVG
jgi:hypothetical protein